MTENEARLEEAEAALETAKTMADHAYELHEQLAERVNELRAEGKPGARVGLAWASDYGPMVPGSDDLTGKPIAQGDATRIVIEVVGLDSEGSDRLALALIADAARLPTDSDARNFLSGIAAQIRRAAGL